MTLKPYGLDREAQQLVTKYLSQDVLNESHKMRVTVAYGLERFWGEHLRHGLDTPEGQYWKDVWDALIRILQPAAIKLPAGDVSLIPKPARESKEEKARRDQENAEAIQAVAAELWDFAQDHSADQRIALAVLTQLCDCLVWWTQRYKSYKS